MKATIHWVEDHDQEAFKATTEALGHTDGTCDMIVAPRPVSCQRLSAWQPEAVLFGSWPPGAVTKITVSR